MSKKCLDPRWLDCFEVNWNALGIEGARRELSLAVSAEIARARAVLSERADLASSVHEARRAIKRARALLKLADPWPRGTHIDFALRDASRALAVLRDADVRVLTADGLHNNSASSEPTAVPAQLLESLQEERGRLFAESGAAGGPLRRAESLLSVALEIMEREALELASRHDSTASNGLELLRLGLGASYESARARSDPESNEGPVDEHAHKLRKRVKDLRYQLEFLETCQPQLGRLVTDLHHLTDLLGDANDLATLSAHTASTDVLCETERSTLTAHVEGAKQVLRSEAASLSERLFEEEPDSFVRRIEAWVTPLQG